MLRNAGKVLVLIGVIVLLLTLLPWLGCTFDFPGNLMDLRIVLGREDLDPGMSGAGLCWQAKPIWANQEQLVAGLGALVIGGVLAALGKDRGTRTALPTHIEKEVTHRRQPLRETERATKVTQREFEHGIEVELDEEELGQIIGVSAEESLSVQVEEENTLMAQVGVQVNETRRMEAIKKDEVATIDGFFCPTGMSQLSLLYVDAAHELAGDDSRDEELGSRDRPYGTIASALKRARQLVRESRHGVQVRLMPGVYQENVMIPPQVALVNHRMPAEGGVAGRLRWLMGQEQVNDQDRVTILAPSSARVAIGCDPGGGQSIYGCHVVGRSGAKQVGIRLSRAERITILNCVIEQFEEGGVFMELSGSDLNVGGVRIMGSIFRHNRAPEGGAVAATESALLIEQCLFEHNTSHRGGAVCVWGMRGMMVLGECEFVSNKSQIKSLPVESLKDISPAQWEEQEGTGGGLWAGSSQIKVTGCEFRGNGASVSGGGIALVACRALVQGSEERPMLFKEGRSRSGGAICVVGGYGKDEGSVLKLNHVHCERNFGQQGGGAILATGGSVVQINASQFEYNEGDEVSSVGGAIYALHGAEIIGTQLLFRANKASMAGGVAGENAAIRLREHCIFQDNVATLGSCGGLYVGVQRALHVEEAIASGELRLPFVTKVLDAEFVGNLSMDAPSAVGIGDMTGESSLMVMGVELGESVQLRSNRVQGKGSAHQEGELRVIWKGEQKYAASGHASAQRFKLS